MTLQSAIESELPFLRAEAEATYQDDFTAFAYVWAQVDGLDEQTWVEQDVTRGKVQSRTGGLGAAGDTKTRTVTVGGVERLVVEGGLHIPLDAAFPTVGWEYVCTAVGPASDPALLGRRWRVVDVPAKSYATARRIDVAEVPA